MKPHLTGTILLTLGGVAAAIAAPPVSPLHEARDGSIVARDGRSFNNRPLYCANTGAFVLAGDRPFIRCAEGRRIHGCFLAAIVRGERSHWLHESTGLVSSYRAGRMSWEIRDPAWDGLELKLDVLPLADRAGFAARVQWQGAREGDRLVWVYGGAAPHAGKLPAAAWEFDILLYPEKSQLGFEPAACAGDLITIEGHRFTLRDSANPLPAQPPEDPVSYQ